MTGYIFEGRITSECKALGLLDFLKRSNGSFTAVGLCACRTKEIFKIKV